MGTCLIDLLFFCRVVVALFWSTSSLELVFVKFKNSKFELWKNLKKILECSLPFVLPVCEFVLRNTLYSFLNKNDKHIFRSGNMFQNLSNLSFLLSQQYKVFHNKNLHNHSIHSWLHPRIFLRIFYNFKNAVLKRLKKGLHGAWVPKRFFCTLYALFTNEVGKVKWWCRSVVVWTDMREPKPSTPTDV
jgi:hypothetical protein